LTLASTIITDAYRESNLIPLGGTPSANQISEGLSRLNNILASSVGNEIGNELRDVNVGGPYDESVLFDFWVPNNARLVLNLSGGTTLYLDPSPDDGQRLAVADVLGTLPTYNLTLNGNGRQIELASSIVLNDDFLTKEWMYRADTGNWTVITPVVAADDMPFPSDFDDYFTMMLALRLDPMHGQNFSSEQIEVLHRGRRNIRSRYRNRKSTYPDYVGRLSGNRSFFLGENFDVRTW
jgi:hypothetical protein